MEKAGQAFTDSGKVGKQFTEDGKVGKPFGTLLVVHPMQWPSHAVIPKLSSRSMRFP